MDTNSEKKEKENQKKFKKVIREMLFLLRMSLRADTLYMHWYNSRKDIFVLENYSTDQKNIVFQDRVSREKLFLGKYATIKTITRLEANVHFTSADLSHHTPSSPVKTIFLIPFVNNAETVALITAEYVDNVTFSKSDEKATEAFQKALTGFLHTSLQLNELTKEDSDWPKYDLVANKLIKTTGLFDLLKGLIEEIQEIVNDKSGTLLLARALDNWHTVLYSEGTSYPPPVGIEVQKNSIAEQALAEGEPVFITHFNASPSRISVVEPLYKGATLAIPIMHCQRRQLLVMVYGEDPALFTETLKHKVIHLCRVVSLKLEALFPHLEVPENLFSGTLSCYSYELISGSLSTILNQSRKCPTSLKTWGGMISIGNIVDFRTRYTLQELRELQKEALVRIKPQNFHLTGIIGKYSDYVYLFILQSADENAFNKWIEKLRAAVREPILFSDNKKETVKIHFGYCIVDEEEDADTIINKSKKAMNEAVKEELFKKQA